MLLVLGFKKMDEEKHYKKQQAWIIRLPKNGWSVLLMNY